MNQGGAIRAPTALQQTRPGIMEARGFEIDLANRELRAQGVAIPIGSRAFEILEMLVEASGDLVTKDDLMKSVWPNMVVEDNTVQVHIAALRKALGSERSMLQTVPGRGYRLLGDWVPRTVSGGHQQHLLGQPPTSGSAFLTNVPVAASALVGRETAVYHLRDLVSAYRVVTLTGPGGMGKTSLATEVARRMFPTFEGDVFFIELVSLPNADLVPSAVAYALHLQLRGDELSAESVARSIGARRVLLLLDNCEHVIDAAALTAEALVRLCPNVTILATSREDLRIDGEIVYRVPALEVPAEASDPTNMLMHSAVQLFVSKMRSLQHDFSPTDASLPVVAAICRHLDGIPLAIELAAARAATLGIQQVSSRLDDRFTLLTGGRRTAFPRHQTLRATLDWSYELLSDAERLLLRQLSVFPAGFTLEAATAVVDETGSAVAIGISNLVSKSLVAMEGSEANRRWRLLETVRVYALQKLSESGEFGDAMRRLAQLFLRMFAPFTAEAQLQSALDDLRTFRAEVGNLRAALSWAFSSCGDYQLGVQLAATASDFWVAVSLVAEAGEWAVKALDRIGEAAGTRCEMVLRCSLGFTLIYTQGSSVGAREALMQALALARELSDFDYQQRAVAGLWLFSARSMTLNDALGFARDYEAVAQDRDLQSRVAAAWLVGVPQTYLASHSEASERLKWAVEQYPVGRRHRDMIRFGADIRASALSHNTVNLLSQGFLDAATQSARRAIEEARSTDQPFVMCVALAWAAGFVSLSLGDLDAASAYGEELVDRAYKHGMRPFYAAGLCVRGTVEAKLGRPESGVDSLRIGLAAMKDARYFLFYPFFRRELAEALGSLGWVDDAVGEIDEALGFAKQAGYRWFTPEILRTQGELMMLSARLDPAQPEKLFYESMELARAQGAVYWELSSATSLAELLRTQKRNVEARATLTSVYSRLTEGFSAPRVKQAKLLLDAL